MGDSSTTETPLEIKTVADRYVGKRVLIVSTHPHTGHTGTVDRIEFFAVLGKWGFVVKFDNGLSGAVFSSREWSIL